MSEAPATPIYQSVELEVENDRELYEDDGESFLSSSGESSTTSLSSSIRRYQFENGRRYHAYREGAYHLPNDEQEQGRLEISHHVHKLKINGQLYRSPLPPNITRVLDLGTGTGVWAIELADQFPHVHVIGNDLSPIQPTWVPPNCTFEVDDLEAEWQYHKPFDFIHARDLQGSVSDYPRLLKQAYDNLVPGGWFEFSEADIITCGDDDTIKNAPCMVEISDRVNEASNIVGKPLGTAWQHKKRLADAGFVNIKEEVYKIPMSPWVKDKKLKEIGRYEQVNMIEGIHSYSLAPLTRVLGWPIEKTRALLEGGKRELLDRNIHIYSNWFHVYGQKPEEEPERYD